MDKRHELQPVSLKFLVKTFCNKLYNKLYDIYSLTIRPCMEISHLAPP